MIKRSNVLAIALIITIGSSLLLAAVVTRFSPIAWLDERREMSFDISMADEVVAQINAGFLKPDARGRLTLTGRYADLVAGGVLRVDQTNRGKTKILFPTWRGRAYDLRGYLWSRPPLDQNDLRPFPQSEQPAVRFQISDYVRGTGTVGVDMFVDRELSRGWYKVRRDLD
jgi:hypothetical protein